MAGATPVPDRSPTHWAWFRPQLYLARMLRAPVFFLEQGFFYSGPVYLAVHISRQANSNVPDTWELRRSELGPQVSVDSLLIELPDNGLDPGTHDLAPLFTGQAHDAGIQHSRV